MIQGSITMGSTFFLNIFVRPLLNATFGSWEKVTLAKCVFGPKYLVTAIFSLIGCIIEIAVMKFLGPKIALANYSWNVLKNHSNGIIIDRIPINEIRINEIRIRQGSLVIMF